MGPVARGGRATLLRATWEVSALKKLQTEKAPNLLLPCSSTMTTIDVTNNIHT